MSRASSTCVFSLAIVAAGLALPLDAHGTAIGGGPPIFALGPAYAPLCSVFAQTQNGSAGAGCNQTEMGFGADPGGIEFSTATTSYALGNAAVSGSGWTNAVDSSVFNSSGDAEVAFYFEVVGAPGLVPLIFTGSGSTSATGFDTVAQAYFETPGGDAYACSGTGNLAGGCSAGEPANYAKTFNYSVSANVPYDVVVMIAGASTEGTGTWNAWVDPQVQIDPSFAGASDYSIGFSPGPTSTTPEPSALWLVCSGILPLARRFSRRWVARRP